MSFEDAKTAFYDETAMVFHDPDHSDEEDRFILLGIRLLGVSSMRDHYDFSKMKGKKNPYTKQLKQPVTMRLDKDTVAYFKSLSDQMGIPYQSLFNLYLRDCAMNERTLEMKWVAGDKK